jgi:hypothetical protein
MKEGERILIYGFICENVDNSGGQNGTVSTINIRNCSGGCVGQNYQAIINDLTIVNSIFRNACWGIEIAARSSSAAGSGGGVSFPMKRAAFLNDLQYNISGSNPGCPGTKIGMQMSSAGQSWQGTITSDGTTATFAGNCSVDAGGCPDQIASYTITSGGTACSPATGGTLTISAPSTGGHQATGTYTCLAGTALSGVTITNPGSRYMSGTPTVTGFSGTCMGCAITLTLNSAPITPSAGFEVMDVSAGDPVSISGCTAVTAFNVPTHNVNGGVVPVGIGPLASTGSALWTGTYSPAGVTVKYPWTTSGTDSAGFCTLTNIEGGPQNVTLQHHTLITDANQTIGNGNTSSNGPNFQINHLFENSILLSSGATSAGWYNSVAGEGTPTEKFNYDYTSMTAYKLVWPGRTNTKYTEYGNAPGYPDPNGCTGTGCNPPTATGMYFPANTCGIGFNGTGAWAYGTCSGNAVPLTTADYHQYQLNSGSTFHNAASDGTDIGTIIPSLDTAQTTTQYVCTGSCGSIGPYPD